MSLFLSANEDDVREAIDMGFAAGHVMGHAAPDDGDMDLRIAFDFDGVLADDSAERVFQSEGLDGYQESESALAEVPLSRVRWPIFWRRSTEFRGLRSRKVWMTRRGIDAGCTLLS